MQKAVFLWLCLLFSGQLLGQQTPQITQKNDIRIETYFYHQTNYDSFRLHIKGKNDTFLTETFYRNGRLQEQVFGKDSTLNFNRLGIITSKYFGERDSFYLFGENREVTEKSFFKQDDNTWDSTVSCFDKWVNINSIRYEDSYNAIGNDTIHTIRYPIGQYGSYGYSQKVGAMFKQKAFFRDTIFEDGEPIPQQIDTVFRENGYLVSITIQNGDEGVTLSYDSAGKLRKDLDEKTLIPFKDNILCAYGFLNELGDTIVSARYDRVERLYYIDAIYKVFVGDKCFLLKYPNIILNTPEANDIEINGYLRAAKSLWGSYIYRIDSLYGLLDDNGKILVTPQKYKLLACGITKKNDTICSYYTEEGVWSGHLNAQLRPIFSASYQQHLLDNGYFEYWLKEDKDKKGLMSLKKEIILPDKFDDFDYINDSIILATLTGYNKFLQKTGVFNLNTKQWILDTNYLLYYHLLGLKEIPIIFQHRQTLKYGLVNQKWEVIVPPQYDSISYVKEKLYIVRKNNKYGLFHLDKGLIVPSQYDSLVFRQDSLFIAKQFDKVFFIDFKKQHTSEPTHFYEDLRFAHANVLDTINNEATNIYYAKKGGKWGIVNEQNQVLYPFSANYVGENMLVHDKKVFYYTETSFPRPDIVLPLFEGVQVWLPVELYDGKENELVLFIDKAGNVVVPPLYYIVKESMTYPIEYFVLNKNEMDFHLVENQAKQRKIVLVKSGIFADYPFPYYPRHAAPHSKLIIVSDTSSKNKAQNIGIVNASGRLLSPCQNFAATIGDPIHNIYFLRPDTPLLLKSHYQLDTNWIMYDYEGKQLGVFREPFTFHQGLGVGRQGDFYGIFDTLGKAVTPPQYPNIYREPKNNFMYLFENQGVTTTVTLKNAKGETLIAAGKYDGISDFYGKYALVSAGEKIGLIDTLGREIIAPLDLTTANHVHFIDSLDIVNQLFWKEVEELKPYYHKLSSGSQGTRSQSLRLLYTPTPIAKGWGLEEASELGDFLEDTIGLDKKMQNQIWNLLLEIGKEKSMIRMDKKNEYYTVKIIMNGKWNNKPFNKMPLSASEKPPQLKGIYITSKTISFALGDYWRINQFANFIFQNGSWKKVFFQDVLDIGMYKRMAINDLLMKKIKALKGVELDCTEGSDFVKQVLANFMLTKTGIDFCFLGKNYGGMIPIACTWEELRPFLKMRF